MFKIGDEVICVKPFKGINTLGIPINVRLPIKGKIYIVDGFSDSGFIYLKGFALCLFGTSTGRVAFDITKFRKLSDILLQKELAQKALKQTEETLDIPIEKEELVEQI